MEKKKPIGLIIKEIIEEKKLSITDIANQLEVSRANVYNVFGRDRMKPTDLQRWSEVLGESVDYIQSLQKADKTESTIPDFGAEIIGTIEKLIKEELREKNEQIRSLQRALENTQESLRESQRLASALLGKLHEYPVSPVMPRVLATAPLGAMA